MQLHLTHNFTKMALKCSKTRQNISKIQLQSMYCFMFNQNKKKITKCVIRSFVYISLGFFITLLNFVLICHFGTGITNYQKIVITCNFKSLYTRLFYFKHRQI